HSITEEFANAASHPRVIHHGSAIRQRHLNHAAMSWPNPKCARVQNWFGRFFPGPKRTDGARAAYSVVRVGSAAVIGRVEKVEEWSVIKHPWSLQQSKYQN